MESQCFYSKKNRLLSVGKAIAFSLLVGTVGQIVRNWDELWAEAE